MNKLGGKLYSGLRAYRGGESRLGAQTAIRVPVRWRFVHSLRAMLVENRTFHVIMSLHRACVSVAMAGYKWSAHLSIINSDHFGGPS